MPTINHLASRTAGAVLVALLLNMAPAARSADKPEFLNSGKVLAGKTPFSEAVRLGNMLYLSGQVGVAPGTFPAVKLVPGGMRAEAKQALENIRAILMAHGRTTSDLVKCTVMLADMADWPAFNEVWMAFLKPPYPARSAIGANGLALGARVEIECIASAGP